MNVSSLVLRLGRYGDTRLVSALFYGFIDLHNMIFCLSVATEPLPGFHVCIITSAPRYFYEIWIPSLCVDVILFFLALWAGLRWRTSEKINLVQISLPLGSGLWHVLLRDSITFPFLSAILLLFENGYLSSDNLLQHPSGVYDQSHHIPYPSGESFLRHCVLLALNSDGVYSLTGSNPRMHSLSLLAVSSVVDLS